LLADALKLSRLERDEFEAAADRGRGRAPRIGQPPTPPNNLPVRLTSFVGRNEEIAAIKGLDREQFIRGTGATKKAYTKGRWRAAFWEAMRNEFWLPRLRGGRRNDFAPLTFVGFQLWFLLDSLEEPDSEDFPYFNLQLMSNPMESRFAQQVQERKLFTRDRSPYDAAREVAEFLRGHARTAGTLEEIVLANGTLVRIDHAGGHWTSKPDIDPALLPLAVSGNNGTYALERGLRFTRTNSS
jgi:hypothetical protein